MEITSIQQLNKLKSCDYDKVTKISLKSFYGKKIDEVPMYIGFFDNLESLNLSWNQFTMLPDSIGYLVKLKSLDLSFNSLRELPESIKFLVNLQSLILSYSGLTRLPESIGSLVKLKLLHLMSVNSHMYDSLKLPDSFYKISRHCYIKTNSEALLNNLPNNLEYLCFEELELPLTNLPSSLIELRLKNCKIKENIIKLPYGCNLIRI